MNNNRVNEIKKEDKKAFKKYAVVIAISAIVGGIFGYMSVSLKEVLGDTIPSFLMNMFDVITPFASVVLSVLLIIIYQVVYRNSRKQYDLWKAANEEDDEIIDKIEERLSYIMLFTAINIILGFFFFGMGGMSLPFSKINGDLSTFKAVCFVGGFLLCMISSTLIQKKMVNFEKEINPLLKGSVYDTKFTEKWLDSCDEAIKLEIYKSAFKAYTAVSTTCVILWVICVLGYDLWDFGVMPMVMVIIIWLVQTIVYCMASIKESKSKSK